jgi:hypothetical protein
MKYVGKRTPQQKQENYWQLQFVSQKSTVKVDLIFLYHLLRDRHLISCKLGPLDVGLLSFEDIYRVMAVNEVKKICNAKLSFRNGKQQWENQQKAIIGGQDH